MPRVCGLPANTRHPPNAGPMLGQRRRRWTNIGPALGGCLVFARLGPQEGGGGHGPGAPGVVVKAARKVGGRGFVPRSGILVLKKQMFIRKQ